MKTQLKIVIIAAIVIFGSFLPDLYPTFFGDWYCKGSGKFIDTGYVSHSYYQFCNYAQRGFHDACWHWGYRHWIYLIFGIILVIYNAVDIAVKLDEK